MCFMKDIFDNWSDEAKTIYYQTEKISPEKKKEPCLSFVKKTNSEICAIVKKQLRVNTIF